LVPLIIRVLPCGTLSQTSNLENFVRALQVDRVVNDSSASTVELVDDTYRTIDESWLFTASRPTVTLWLHSIYCGFVVQLVSTDDKILTDTTVRLRWQSFLFFWRLRPYESLSITATHSQRIICIALKSKQAIGRCQRNDNFMRRPFRRLPVSKMTCEFDFYRWVFY